MSKALADYENVKMIDQQTDANSELRTASLESIAAWRKKTLEEQDPASDRVIAGLLRGTLALFSGILKHAAHNSSMTGGEQKALRRSYAALHLWAVGHKALEGTLDIILERSRALQDTTLETIRGICGLLLNREHSTLSHVGSADMKELL